MLLDAEQELSTAQAITATALSENIIDLTSTRGAQAQDDQLWLVVRVGTAFATLTSLTIEIWNHTTTTVTSGTMLLRSAAIPVASLTANTTVFKCKVPVGLTKRYLGLNYTVAGSNATTGTVDAFLTNSMQDNDYSA